MEKLVKTELKPKTDGGYFKGLLRGFKEKTALIAFALPFAIPYLACRPQCSAQTFESQSSVTYTQKSTNVVEGKFTLIDDYIKDLKNKLKEGYSVDLGGSFSASYQYNTRPGTGNNLYRSDDHPGTNSIEPKFGNIHLSRTPEGQLGFNIDLFFVNTAESFHGFTHYYNGHLGPRTPIRWVDPNQIYLTYTLPNGLSLSAGRFKSFMRSGLGYNYTLGQEELVTPGTVAGIRGIYNVNQKIKITLGINSGGDNIANDNYLRTGEAQLQIRLSKDLEYYLSSMYGPSGFHRFGPKTLIIDNFVRWKTPLQSLTVLGEQYYIHQDSSVDSVGRHGGQIICTYDFSRFQSATRFEIGVGMPALGNITETVKIPLNDNLTAYIDLRHDQFSKTHISSSESATVNNQNTLMLGLTFGF